MIRGLSMFSAEELFQETPSETGSQGDGELSFFLSSFMATNRLHEDKDCIYFITFTCLKWINLFEITSTYSRFDQWFSYLQKQQVSLLGYVIMPNHFHGLLYIPNECPKRLNTLVANGKRFLAYDIVAELKSKGRSKVLEQLSASRSKKDIQKGSNHKVFIPSFDAKLCFNRKMAETKLEYIHHNPVQGKWQLVDDYVDYAHSSASYYMREEEHPFVQHYRDFI